MLPEISEFSYGFALTNELVGWTELFAAPVFPSLIEEGKAGGGYDVKLDQPGAPLYLQFKRSERMERTNAREVRAVREARGRLDTPFYRFPITMAFKSAQHELLLALDSLPNLVFYAAPRFHRIDEINDAWRASAIASRSMFVAPSALGALDDRRHNVAFDSTSTWVCSEPRSITTLNSRQLLEKIQSTLKSDQRPLREKLPGLIEGLRSAERRVRERLKKRQVSGSPPSEQLTPETIERPEPTPPATRAARELRPELHILRDAADIAARQFNTQLVIIQPPRK